MRPSSLLAALMCLTLGVTAAAQHELPPLQNAFLRPHTSLNGDWQHFPDRYEAYFYDFLRVPFDSSSLGKTDFAALDAVAQNRTERYEYAFDGQPTLAVPGDWNSQYERYLLYEGSMWYRKKFDVPHDWQSDERLVLRFGAANYRADVYVNGTKAGQHIGGFTPFAFDITSLITPGEANSLVVRVDNQRSRTAVPTDVTDWWNYGGLTRDVSLYTLPSTYITDYTLQLSQATFDSTGARGIIRGTVQLHGPLAANQHVELQLVELNLNFTARTDSEGKASFSTSTTAPVRIPRPWSPADPYLYTFVVDAADDVVVDRIGLRTIETQGTSILLNDQPIFLRGICAHEENPLRGGRANGPDDAALLLGWARELGANFMRLAHYPHNEYMPRLADSMGILLWEEVPVYWTINWDNPATYDNAEQQLTELVLRDRNRASVIIWSLANETPDIPARLKFLRKLADRTRELDSTRLLSAALFKEKVGPHHYEVVDPFAQYADVVSFNEYIGWYEGTPAVLDHVNFSFTRLAQDGQHINKPVIISEFGAGAKGGLRGDSLTRWSEDYQDWLYRETLELIDRTPEIAGFTPWILADFRSPRRNLPGIQDGWNRKGLISQHGKRKLAFQRLQRYYRTKSSAAGNGQK